MCRDLSLQDDKDLTRITQISADKCSAANSACLQFSPSGATSRRKLRAESPPIPN